MCVCGAVTGSGEVQSQGVRAEGAPGPGSGGPDPPQVLRQGAGGRPPREHPSVPGGTTLPSRPALRTRRPDRDPGLVTGASHDKYYACNTQ